MSQSESEPKGNIRADISDDVLAEALAAVEGRPPETEVVVEAEAGGEDPAALREELRQRELLLEEAARRTQELMARLKDEHEARLRAAADLENYKRRAQREKEDVQRFGIERLLQELIPVLDNFDRALDHAATTSDVRSFAEGVAMTRRTFEETLGKHGVKCFTAVGEPFDPRLHEAIQQVESHEHPANVVVHEVVRGYLLHERLVRPAMVAVSSGPGPAASGEAAPGEAEAENRDAEE